MTRTHQQAAGARGGKGEQALGRSRRYRRHWRIGVVIAKKSNSRRRELFDQAANRERNIIERLTNRLTQFRRVPTRYAKLAANFLTTVTLASSLLSHCFAQPPLNVKRLTYQDHRESAH